MEKKKALLVMAGGRAAPDVLSLLYVQPQLVRVIISKEGWKAKQAFEDIAHSLPSCTVDIIPDIDAYDLEAGMRACRDACQPYPETEWDWTFTIGSSPKITGIAAYEVAKEKGVPCWHIDTRHEHVVSLVKETTIDKQSFFHLNLRKYMKIQNRRWRKRSGPGSDYRKKAQTWADVAEELVRSPDAIYLLPLLFTKDAKNAAKTDVQFNIPTEMDPSGLLQFLENYGLLKITHNDVDGMITCSFTSPEAAQFVGTGDWLEVYVWKEAEKAGFADDHQWGCQIINEAEKDLDLALLYKAQLLIAECKAEREPFKGRKGFLAQLDATAKLLGGEYVSKLFITNQPGMGESYENFCKQARDRNIVVVTGERLPEIGKILRNEAMNPTYERI